MSEHLTGPDSPTGTSLPPEAYIEILGSYIKILERMVKQQHKTIQDLEADLDGTKAELGRALMHLR